MKNGTYGSVGMKVWLSTIRDLAAASVCAASMLLHGPTSAISAEIVIREAWSRATPKGVNVAAGYLTIENRGDTADRLVSASTPVARKVAIHEMLQAGGVMRMRATDGLTIPPHGKLVLAQGGSHLMFLQLAAPLSEGERVPVSLDFEKTGQIDTSLEVGGVGAKGPPSTAASEGAVAKSANRSDSFFTHIHDPRFM